MARPQFRVTYDIVTPESAEDGEAAESGYVEPGAWHYAVGKESPEGMSLREARGLCGCMEDSGRWFSEVDGTPDYEDGSHEYRALHPPANVTRASYRRLARILGVRTFGRG
jgi:hypothetical protein